MSTYPLTFDKPPLAPAAGKHDTLPPGTCFGEFEIIRVLGVGGFGIVYLAHDRSLERAVALKEYMPASLAARGAGPQITVRSSAYAETYAAGLRSFINEARLLARFDHPALVKVHRFWEDNATAYMVMPFLQGVTLRDARRGMAHAPDEAWIRSVIAPLLSALELLHREGVFHRDVAPDNILLPRDGPPVLLDFGAARRVINDRPQSITAILKPSYAPIEQYAEMTGLRQGPWTDLYGLGAVVHYLLFGAPPAPATVRAVQDQAEAIEDRQVRGVSRRFLEVVSWMLAVRPGERPQSGEELRAVLDGRADVPRRAGFGMTLPPAMLDRRAAPPTDTSRVITAQIATFLPTVGNGARAEAPTTFEATITMARPMSAPPAARGLVQPVTRSSPTVPDTAPRTGMPASPAPASPAVQPSVRSLQAASSAASSAAVPVGPRAGKPTRTGSWIAVAVAGLALTVGWAGREIAGARNSGAAPATANLATATAIAATSSSALTAAPSAAPETPIGRPTEAITAGGSTNFAGSLTAPERGADAVPSERDGIARREPAPTSRIAAPAAGIERVRPALKPMPAVARVSASEPGPVPVIGASPPSAREACARSSNFIARAVCMDERCEEPRFRTTAVCAGILARKTARENR